MPTPKPYIDEEFCESVKDKKPEYVYDGEPDMESMRTWHKSIGSPRFFGIKKEVYNEAIKNEEPYIQETLSEWDGLYIKLM